jgi:gluconate 2-dehydrogenase gamma chain
MGDDRRVITRRDLLKQAGLAGAAAALPAGALAATPGKTPAVSPPPAAAPVPPPATLREPLEALTAAEADLLEAICARLIPTDDNGPGAREARAAHYIDRALAGALKDERETYRAGLAALDRYAAASRGRPFTALSPDDQDSVLVDVETGAATGFAGSPARFFALVRSHTWQGTFGDPYYGGNRNFIGWDLVGYPGVRLMVTADMQQLDAHTPPNHRSAYDNPQFVKAVVENRATPEADSGD